MRLSAFVTSAARGFRIDCKRLYLRPLQQGDWREWAALRETSREFLVPWEPTWAHDALTRGAFRRRVRAYDREWQQGTAYSLLIVRRDDEHLLGGATLSNLRRGVAQSASLGYWIAAPYARQGFMTEALGGVLDFAFDDLALHRIDAACLPNNLASQALLQRIGFAKEGYAREFLRINGRWQDHLLFGMLRDDWRQERK